MAKKGKKHEPFLPLFVGDFFAATAEWEGEEEALYVLLLMRQWSLGHLPTSIPKLARLVRYDQRTFEQWWPTVSKKFSRVDVPGEGQRLLNQRLEIHRAKAHAISEKNATSGRKGAEAKWRNDGDRHHEGMANASYSDGERQTPKMADATDSDGERYESAIAERHRKMDGASDGNPYQSNPYQSIPDQRSIAASSQDSGGGTPNEGGPEPHAIAEGKGRAGPSSQNPNDVIGHIQSVYPAGHYRASSWLKAAHFIAQRLDEGVTAYELIRAASDYHAQQHSRGKVGTEFVLSPAKFYESEWRGPFPLALSKGEQRQAENISAGIEWLAEGSNG